MGQFSATKQNIKHEIGGLVHQLTTIIHDLDEIWYESQNNIGWSPKEVAEHIYLVNQYVISKVKYTRALILEGFVNNETEYEESDLQIVDMMLAVSIYRIQTPEEFSKSLCFSAEEMKLKLVHQINILLSLVDELPEEMISNYKEHSKFISGIKLDLYQLIYLAVIHGSHHMKQVATLNAIEKSLNQQELVYSYV